MFPLISLHVIDTIYVDQRPRQGDGEKLYTLGLFLTEKQVLSPKGDDLGLGVTASHLRNSIRVETLSKVISVAQRVIK